MFFNFCILLDYCLEIRAKLECPVTGHLYIVFLFFFSLQASSEVVP
jgi:hypothetical protein